MGTRAVPKPSWYSNLRERMGRQQWDQLRKQVYEDSGHKCAVCDAEGVRLNCHEIWEYDDEKHVQRLLGFTVLCNMYHAVKHIGMTQILAEQGRYTIALVPVKITKVFGEDGGLAGVRGTIGQKLAFESKLWRSHTERRG